MRPRRASFLLPLVLLPFGCANNGSAAASGDSAASGAATLYTCVSDTTIQPLVAEFEEQNPGSTIDLFRAPTGELNARIAGDVRSGGLKADAVWACDPLTMQGYVDQDLVGGWTPDEAAEVQQEYRTDDYVGVAVLYMVAVHSDGAPAPQSWADLAQTQGVAVPDPAVAASALGALGYFAQSPDHGLEFYQDLQDNGAVQVSTPDDVTTGVAQGVYQAGITIANSAYAAEEAGSPVGVVWPEPGAVAIYGPIAVATDSDSQVAKDFAAFVVSDSGQQVLAEAGSYPTLPRVDGPTIPADAAIVSPDWAAIGAEKDGLLSEYEQIFGG
jgi:iron(III) transport system substrate-binding protein